MLGRSSGERRPGGIDYSVLIPLLVHAFAVQLLTSVVRITTSYRILEDGLPVVWLGVISGAFALFPVFIAVPVGRFIDRGNDAKAAWIGSALMAAPTIGFYAWPGSPIHLLIYTLLLGAGHLFLMASQQMLAARAGGERGRDAAFGNFQVAQALGSALGPFIIGWIGGAATTPPTHVLFGLSVLFALASLAASFAVRPERGAHAQKAVAPAVPLPELLRTKGFTTILIASIITITASDLLVIYLPLLGAERGIDVSHIGTALSVRSATTMLSRMLFPTMVRILGRHRLTVWSMIVGSFAFLLIAIPLPIGGLYAGCAILGLGLGLASTLSITSIIEIVPANARGTAMTLRITGNRLGQVFIPFVGSVIAAVAGAGGVLGIIAANLFVSGLAVHFTRKRT